MNAETARLTIATLELKSALQAAGLEPDFAEVEAKKHAARLQIADDGTVADAATLRGLVDEITAQADPRWKRDGSGALSYFDRIREETRGGPPLHERLGLKRPR